MKNTKISNLSNPIFHDENKAIEYLEKIRWQGKIICPHCGKYGKIYKIEGKKTRKGLKKCGHCRKQFTITVGTLFEGSHVPIYKWLQAVYLICSSKKGISSHQLHRTLAVTYKTAWFMTHRIREAMYNQVTDNMFLGGNGKIVEADETFFGNKNKKKKGARGWGHMNKIFSLVERGGNVRSFHVEKVTGKTLKSVIRKNIKKDSNIITDDFKSYYGLSKEYWGHAVVNHSKGEYVRGIAYTNTIENFFSILKRGLIGVYQHCGPQHLKRYIGEFDFRYNHRKVEDYERSIFALKGIEGKRLLYRDSLLTTNN